MDTVARSSCLFVLIVLCGTVPARANLVQNGNFIGGSDAGWTFAVQDVSILPGAELVNSPCPLCSPFATFQSVPINGGTGWLDPIDIGYGTLTQTLATTPGRRYEISYTLGVLGDSDGAFFASFGGEAFLPSTAELAEMGFPSAPSNYLNNPPSSCNVGALTRFCGLFFGGPEVSQESFSWTATSSSTVLEFAGASPGGDFIVSDVSAVPVPEPASLALLLAGSGILVLVRRKWVAKPAA